MSVGTATITETVQRTARLAELEGRGEAVESVGALGLNIVMYLPGEES